MLLVIAGLAWAGVLNLRARRAALEANHVELTPAKADAAAPDAAGGQLQGKPAPAFSLVSTDGKKVSLSDFKGRPVIVNFWATWCGPCKLEMPWFEEFSKKYAAQGLVVLGLNQDDGMAPAEVAREAKHIGVSYPVLMPDKDEHVSKEYGGVDYLPETFYVDRSGKVAAISSGAPSKDQMQGLIEMALAGK
ncbi:MAG TPA: TlpA disulfide reductase family protein [Acidobacteriaceae bacterium]|nr:TlpA disulfide reductase family protein [Acidobacteriaceae bacterium]